MTSLSKKHKVTDLNPFLICVLCKGYYIDATTIVECLHSFCKTCIVKYLKRHKYCPICDVLVYKTKPLQNIRPDKRLQNVVYKLIPGLYEREMQRRKMFFSSQAVQNTLGLTPEDQGIISENSDIILADENISIALEYLAPTSDVNKGIYGRRYLRCKASAPITILHKFLKNKFNLSNKQHVEIVCNNELLADDLSVMDVAYIYQWKKKTPMYLAYRILETKIKRIHLNVSVENSKRLKLNADLSEAVPALNPHCVDKLVFNDSKCQPTFDNRPQPQVNTSEWKEVELKINDNGEMSATVVKNANVTSTSSNTILNTTTHYPSAGSNFVSMTTAQPYKPLKFAHVPPRSLDNRELSHSIVNVTATQGNINRALVHPMVQENKLLAQPVPNMVQDKPAGHPVSTMFHENKPVTYPVPNMVQENKPVTYPVPNKAQENKPIVHPVSNLAQENKPAGYPVSIMLQDNKPVVHHVPNMAPENKPVVYPVPNTTQENKPVVHLVSNMAQEDKSAAHPVPNIAQEKLFPRPVPNVAHENKSVAQPVPSLRIPAPSLQPTGYTPRQSRPRASTSVPRYKTLKTGVRPWNPTVSRSKVSVGTNDPLKPQENISKIFKSRNVAPRFMNAHSTVKPNYQLTPLQDIHKPRASSSSVTKIDPKTLNPILPVSSSASNNVKSVATPSYLPNSTPSHSPGDKQKFTRSPQIKDFNPFLHPSFFYPGFLPYPPSDNNPLLPNASHPDFIKSMSALFQQNSAFHTSLPPSISTLFNHHLPSTRDKKLSPPISSISPSSSPRSTPQSRSSPNIPSPTQARSSPSISSPVSVPNSIYSLPSIPSALTVAPASTSTSSIKSYVPLNSISSSPSSSNNKTFTPIKSSFNNKDVNIFSPASMVTSKPYTPSPLPLLPPPVSILSNSMTTSTTSITSPLVATAVTSLPNSPKATDTKMSLKIDTTTVSQTSPVSSLTNSKIPVSAAVPNSTPTSVVAQSESESAPSVNKNEKSESGKSDRTSKTLIKEICDSKSETSRKILTNGETNNNSKLSSVTN